MKLLKFVCSLSWLSCSLHSALSASYETSLSVGSPSTCGSASNIVVTSLSATCDGDVCNFGDYVRVTGTGKWGSHSLIKKDHYSKVTKPLFLFAVQYKDLSSETAYVVVKLSALGGVLQYALLDNYEIDLCDGVSSGSGSSCPEDGTYSFDQKVQLPSEGNQYWFIRNLSIMVVGTFSDGSNELGCSKAQVKMTQGYRIAYSAAVFSLFAIPIVGVGVSSMWYRQYRLETDESLIEKDAAPQIHHARGYMLDSTMV